MHGGSSSLFRIFLCFILVLDSISTASPLAVGDKGQGLMGLLPKDIKHHELLPRVSFKDYLSLLHISQEMLDGFRLPLRTELKMLRQNYDRKSAFSLMRMCVGDIKTSAGNEEVGPAALGESLKKLVDMIFVVLGEVVDRNIVWTCCSALVTDSRLDVSVWEAYVDVTVKGITSGAVSRGTVIERLEFFLIAAAEAGSVEVIKTIISRSKHMDISLNLATTDNYAIKAAAEHGHVKVVEYLFAKKEEQAEVHSNINPAAGGNFAVQWASKNGHTQMVRLLLVKKEEKSELYESIDPAAGSNYAIVLASQYGRVEVVKLLLAKKMEKPEMYGNINPAARNSYALRLAAKNGHFEVVELLLTMREQEPGLFGMIDPAANDNEALLSAAANGHVDVVKYLLKRKDESPTLYGGIDPAAKDNYAIRKAAESDHAKVVRCLLRRKARNPAVYGGIDPAAADNEALRKATENGHDEVVALLRGTQEEQDRQDERETQKDGYRSGELNSLQ